MKHYDVFVSFNSEQANTVRPIVEYLTAGNLKVWFSEYNVSLDTFLYGSGEDLVEEFEIAINNSKAALLFTSTAWQESKWCQFEYNLILQRIEKNSIIQISLDNTDICQTDMPAPRNIATFNYRDRNIKDVLQFITGKIASSFNHLSNFDTLVADKKRTLLEGGGAQFELKTGPFGFMPFPTDLMYSSVQSFPGARYLLGGNVKGYDARLLVNINPNRTILTSSLFDMLNENGKPIRYKFLAEKAKQLLPPDPDKKKEKAEQKTPMDMSGEEDDFTIYRYYALNARRWYDKEGHHPIGLHRYNWPNRNDLAGDSQMVLTFIKSGKLPEQMVKPLLSPTFKLTPQNTQSSQDVENTASQTLRIEWHRFYAIKVRDIISGTIGEIDLAFCAKTVSRDWNESIRTFCEIIPTFDAIVDSLEYLGKKEAGTLQSPTALPRNVSLLKHIWYQLSGSTVDRFYRKKNIDGLIWALGSKDDSFYKEAIEALVRIGAGTSSQLIRILEDQGESWLRRKNAAVVLGRLESPEAVEPLLCTLGDNNRNVQQGAAWALGIMKEKKALAPLVNLLEHPDSSLFTKAVVIQSLMDIDVTVAIKTVYSTLREVSLYLDQLQKGIIPEELTSEKAKMNFSRTFIAYNNMEEQVVFTLHQMLVSFIDAVLVGALRQSGNHGLEIFRQLVGNDESDTPDRAKIIIGTLEQEKK